MGWLYCLVCFFIQDCVKVSVISLIERSKETDGVKKSDNILRDSFWQLKESVAAPSASSPASQLIPSIRKSIMKSQIQNGQQSEQLSRSILTRNSFLSAAKKDTVSVSGNNSGNLADKGAGSVVQGKDGSRYVLTPVCDNNNLVLTSALAGNGSLLGSNIKTNRVVISEDKEMTEVVVEKPGDATKKGNNDLPRPSLGATTAGRPSVGTNLTFSVAESNGSGASPQ